MIFTPDQSAASLARIITETGIEFEDSSYSNETGDSADATINDKYVLVSFPNVFDREPEHEEEYNVFLLDIDDDRSEYDTIEEVITAINQLK